MSAHDYWIFGFGVVIGWISKVPLLWKWYKELRETRDYQDRKSQAILKELERLREAYAKVCGKL